MVAKQLLKLGFLDSARTVFLACDLQESFRPHMKYFNDMVKVANKMATAATILKIPMYVSEQYPKGLGSTVKEFDTSGASLVYDKTSFSMLNIRLRDALAKDMPCKLDSVVLFGLESHVCVEQSAMAFLAEGVAVHLLADACISRSQQDRILALARMRSLGCFVSTSENLLFKLLRDKKHPCFHEIMKLCKEPTCDTLGIEHATAGNNIQLRLRDLGCFIQTSESVLFKLLKDKENPKFKEILNLCKVPGTDTLGLEAVNTSKL